MELPFEKTVSRFWQQKLYTPVMREETQEYKLPEGMPDVGRIIAAWGQVVLRGKEWRSRYIGLSGGVMVWVLYAPEEGGEPRRIESWIPFSARVEHSHDGDEGVIRAECLLCSVDARTASARKVMLRCNLGIMVQTLLPRTAELCTPGELPGDIEVLDRVYPMILTRETGEKTFLCEERLSLPQGCPPLSRIVYFRLSPRVNEQKVLGSRAVFRGVGDLHLLYQDDRDELHSIDLELPIAQYLDLEGDYEEEAEISNLLCVTSLEVEPDENGELFTRCGLVSQYIVNAPTVVRCLEDAYSPRRELELVQQPVELPAWLEEQARQIELAERLTGEGIPVDQIFFPEPCMVTRIPEGAQVEIGGSFQTLCRNEQGELTGRSQKASHTVSLNTASDTIPCTWLRSGARARREGGGWMLEQTVDSRIASISTRPLDMVTGIRAGELRDPDPERPSIIIRSRHREETLWDIAKVCGSTVSAIQRLNRLEKEPEENRLLLIPVI